ncbi:hypothetical protein B0T25DRAFT_566126 [Lasiosphaeria hispida]|uniref:Clr5 domain-containing protein n=1 Tax=Lasiosphaeria hispida TaxID=260671 RepID=A0AAJ0HL13_9PEZI|nr:hypothetical protein B0T25DRAFT_566126 [Lasiosphaeria hispida]
MGDKHSSHKTKAQFERQLKLWNFVKNLSPAAWKDTDYQTKKQKLEGKETNIIVSGVKMPLKKVRKAVSRSCYETVHEMLRAPPSPPALDDVPVRFSTPPDITDTNAYARFKRVLRMMASQLLKTTNTSLWVFDE